MSKLGDRAPKRISLLGAQAVNVVEGESVSPKNGRGEDAPPGSKEFGVLRSLLTGSWEISKGPRHLWWVAGSCGKATSDTPQR